MHWVVGEGRTQKAVAEELGVNVNLLGRWIKVHRADPTQAFPGHGNLKARDKELEDLRREVARLKGELSFLKKSPGTSRKTSDEISADRGAPRTLPHSLDVRGAMNEDLELGADHHFGWCCQ